MFCLFVFLASFLFIHNDDCIEFDELPQPLEDPPITASSSQNTDLLPHTSPVIEGAHEMDSDGEEESSSQEASPSKPVWKEALSVPALPLATASYNQHMGGVDRGDQIRGYYATKLKCRNFYRYFYRYIVKILVGVAISNSFILHHHCYPNAKVSLKSFHETVAVQLIETVLAENLEG